MFFGQRNAGYGHEVESGVFEREIFNAVGKNYSQTSSSEITLPSLSYLRMIFFLGWDV